MTGKRIRIVGSRERRRPVGFTSILHVNEKGGRFGGTEEYIELVTAALAVHGVRSHLVCGLVAGSLPPELASVDVVEGLAARRPRPGTGDAVVEAISRLRPDVVYLHNVFDPAVVSAVASLDGRGALLWYVHDHYLTCLSELRWRRDVGSCPHRLGQGCLASIGDGRCVLRHPDRRFDDADLHVRTELSRTLADADAVVVVSDYMRTVLGAAAPELGPRLHCLARPIRDIGAGPRRRRTSAAHPAVITYAGRITAEKGLAVVIEALGSVITDAVVVELRIAGVVEDGEYWSRCCEIQAVAAAKNPRLRFVHLGHLDHRAIDEQFRQSDIVVIPSQWPEPLGAVALEAMAAGAAVVASDVGGLSETITHDRNGLHVAPDDVEGWIGAFETLLSSPDHCRRLGVRAHGDAGRHTIEGHIRALDQLVASCEPAN